MKKFIIFLVVIVAICFWAIDYVKSGKLQNYIDSNSDKSWAPKAQYNLGMLYFTASKYEKADYCFRHSTETYPTSSYVVESLYQMGNICEETNKLQQAREIYKKILDDFPNYRKSELIRKKYNFLLNY